MRPGSGPDLIEAKKRLVGKRRNDNQMANRRNAADGEAGFVAYMARIGTLQRLPGQRSCFTEIEPVVASDQEQIEFLAGFTLEDQ